MYVMSCMGMWGPSMPSMITTNMCTIIINTLLTITITTIIINSISTLMSITIITIIITSIIHYYYYNYVRITISTIIILLLLLLRSIITMAPLGSSMTATKPLEETSEMRTFDGM